MLGLTPGPGEMIIIGVIALLLFGKRLPEVARNVGKSLGEFKRSISGFENEIRSTARDAEQRIDYSDDGGTESYSETAQTVPDDDDEDDFGAPKFKIQD